MIPVRRSSKSPPLTRHSMFSAVVTSVLAGSVAGAVGVGVAYPFDSLKTKAQLQQTNAQLQQASNMFQTMAAVYKQEGIAGFFGGVRASKLQACVCTWCCRDFVSFPF
jgi:Mitochondrial carrier protein